MKILVVEDEMAIAHSITEYLSGEGYSCDLASDYMHADEKAQLNNYDCILLDINLPGGSGMDILKQLKTSKPNAAVIIISAKNSLGDKITGLEIGADDYITKPFHLSELNARIKSVIRRRNFGGSNKIIFGDIVADLNAKTVMVKGAELSLTRKEYDLLIFFLSNQNRTVTKEAITEHLWGDQPDSKSLDLIYSHIKNLRKKIMEAGAGDYIEAIYGMGYKFREA
ncbi:MAG: response regulator transcription factor [Bacteroidia bacterium]|nr:response regulator transcription factor [Bacteroidia bacterium]